MESIISADILTGLPAADEALADRMLARALADDRHKLIVLDDDPTGVQTVHDVSVYTDWSAESIKSGLREPQKAFYILTNSRGMTAAETAAVHRDIAANIVSAAAETGCRYMVMSRSDSTLRGHYPLETETLRRGLEQGGLRLDGEILCPFFLEGGRFTLGNTHYVHQDGMLVPAAQTEFAADPTFGYHHSDLPSYVEEKTGGRFPAAAAVCISLEELRAQDYGRLTEKLMGVRDFQKVCVNAVSCCDLKILAAAVYGAAARGRRFLFRTASSLVKIMAGIPDVPLLRRSDMLGRAGECGGVVIVGSYTQKTTAQLDELLKLDCTVPIAFNSGLLLEGDARFSAEVDRCVAAEEEAVRSGRVAVCFTGRRPLVFADDTPESALRRSIGISRGVNGLVERLKVTPAFIVAKGGITASSIGTQALHVKKAAVLGQILPGVPVWRLGADSRFPGMPYVIFPGNTGGVTALRQAVEILAGAADDLCGTESGAVRGFPANIKQER